MKKFILPLILLFAACGTEAEVEPDEVQYPIQIGTWQVTSPTNAEWIGAQPSGFGGAQYSMDATAQGDTVRIDTPGEFELTITALDDSSDLDFELAWVDTIRWENGINFDIKLPRGPFGGGGQYFAGPIDRWGVEPGVKLEFQTRYTCGHPLDEFKPIEWALFFGDKPYDPSTDRLKAHYQVYAEGYVETLNHLLCD